MKTPALILCPVGNKIASESIYPHYIDNHWRYNKPYSARLYDTHIFNYNYKNGFELEPDTYVTYENQTGMKWALIKDYLNNLYDDVVNEYEYVGFWDDDLETDMSSMNAAIGTALDQNAKLFQLSLAPRSDCYYDILKQKDGLPFQWTNFIEIMGPFVHVSLLGKIMDLWNRYDIQTGWGLDTILTRLLKHNALVVHSHSMYHPLKTNSSYDKTAAFSEMATCWQVAERDGLITPMLDIFTPCVVENV